MIGKETIKYSIKNLMHRRARSLLTIMSIFVGITTIFIFISFGWGLYDYVGDIVSSTSADKVTILPKSAGAPGLDDTFTLTEDNLDAVKRAPGVYDAVGIYSKVASVKIDDTLKYTFLIAMDPKKQEILQEVSSITTIKGRKLTESDRYKVVLGYNYLIKDKIFPRALDLNDKIEIQGKEFKVIGFVGEIGNPQDDAQIYVTDNIILEIYNNTKGYNMIIATVDVKNIKTTIEIIEKNLRNSRDIKKGEEDFTVSSFEDLIESFTSALNLVIGFVILIALISVLVSTINTANTMITSVLERVKEIGVMKAVGSRNSEIFYIFLFESGTLGFIAGFLGILSGWAITKTAGIILDNLGWGFLSPHYSLTLFLGCITFATITGAISGVIPAINASKINPVDALRYE